METYIFILHFSLPPRSEQVNGAVANEIKHVHSPEVIVVLDPRYDLSNKVLYISTCSIALNFGSFEQNKRYLKCPDDAICNSVSSGGSRISEKGGPAFFFFCFSTGKGGIILQKKKKPQETNQMHILTVQVIIKTFP